MPKTPEEARSQVDGLQRKGVDSISVRFARLDPALLRAIAAESRARNLPVVVRSGDNTDVANALKAGVDGIEGSFRDAIPDQTLAAMKQAHVVYDPALSGAEGLQHLIERDLDQLNRSLILQTAPPELIAQTRKLIDSAEVATLRDRVSRNRSSLHSAESNLLRAWQAGVTLVTGSDAGSLLVFHGPTVQRELELWVEAGIPNDVALQAATWNAAKLLHADRRFGAIRKGLEGTLVMVDGNPLTDIHALSSIGSVILKGERVSRSTLFEEE